MVHLHVQPCSNQYVSYLFNYLLTGLILLPIPIFACILAQALFLARPNVAYINILFLSVFGTLITYYKRKYFTLVYILGPLFN